MGSKESGKRGTEGTSPWHASSVRKALDVKWEFMEREQFRNASSSTSSGARSTVVLLPELSKQP